VPSANKESRAKNSIYYNCNHSFLSYSILLLNLSAYND
jgi:hypothetical protein